MNNTFLFKFSHFFATLLPHMLGARKPYHRIAEFPGKAGAGIFIGSMLLDTHKSRLYRRYNFKTICQLCHLGYVVRTTEPFELNTCLKKKVKAPTKAQYEAIGVTAIDLAVQDYVSLFTQKEQGFAKQLFETLESLYQAQAQTGKGVYFHCKAGKNRSFKALTAYLVYIRCRDQLRDKTLSTKALADEIHQVCRLIKAIRPQVSYQIAWQRRRHEAFVRQCFESYFQR
jgi:hypothetical protein